jgi:hypothetical protein
MVFSINTYYVLPCPDAAAGATNVTHALLRGVITPVELEAHPGSGALPLSARAAIGLQCQIKVNH